MSAGSPFYENGLPRFKGKYQNGKMHGYWEFYRKDGSLMRSGTFHEDEQVGTWTTYARDGSVVKVTEFKN
jgi:antitoxin component YwqK of YwqJK toxin-antitoxin module